MSTQIILKSNENVRIDFILCNKLAIWRIDFNFSLLEYEAMLFRRQFNIFNSRIRIFSESI